MTHIIRVVVIRGTERKSGRAPVEIPGVTASGQFANDVFYEAGDSCAPAPIQRKSASKQRPTPRHSGLLLCL